MSVFTFVVCIQACLIQNAYSQYLSGAFPPGFMSSGAYPLEALAGPAAYILKAPAALAAGGLTGTYGGSSIGDTSVVGELGGAVTNLVAGQVPILRG